MAHVHDRSHHEAPTSAPPALLHSIEQAATRLSLGRTVICREISAGRLRSVKVGRRRLIPEAALGEFVAQLEAEAAE